MNIEKNFGAQHIENKITNLLKPLFKGQKNNFIIINNLAKNWEKIVGTKYHKFCEIKSIKFYKNKSKAKLTISVFNSAVGFFLKNNSEILLERIASLYGYQVIDKIIIKQEIKEVEDFTEKEINLSEKEENRLYESVKDIKDKDLAQSLMKLGRNILSE